MASGEKAGADAIYSLKLEESDFVSVILKGQMGKRWPLTNAFITIYRKGGGPERTGGTAHKLNWEPAANCAFKKEEGVPGWRIWLSI